MVEVGVGALSLPVRAPPCARLLGCRGLGIQSKCGARLLWSRKDCAQRTPAVQGSQTLMRILRASSSRLCAPAASCCWCIHSTASESVTSGE